MRTKIISSRVWSSQPIGGRYGRMACGIDLWFRSNRNAFIIGLAPESFQRPLTIEPFCCCFDARLLRYQRSIALTKLAYAKRFRRQRNSARKWILAGRIRDEWWRSFRCDKHKSVEISIAKRFHHIYDLSYWPLLSANVSASECRALGGPNEDILGADGLRAIDSREDSCHPFHSDYERCHMPGYTFSSRIYWPLPNFNYQFYLYFQNDHHVREWCAWCSVWPIKMVSNIKTRNTLVTLSRRVCVCVCSFVYALEIWCHKHWIIHIQRYSLVYNSRRQPLNSAWKSVGQ